MCPRRIVHPYMDPCNTCPSSIVMPEMLSHLCQPSCQNSQWLCAPSNPAHSDNAVADLSDQSNHVSLHTAKTMPRPKCTCRHLFGFWSLFYFQQWLCWLGLSDSWVAEGCDIGWDECVALELAIYWLIQEGFRNADVTSTQTTQVS